MDGNGRWAESRGFGRSRGHREGAKRVDEIVTESCRLGVKFLTLYAFSTENWNRPKIEVGLLMRLLTECLGKMDQNPLKNRVALRVQGEVGELPKPAQMEIKRVIRQTNIENPAMILNLSLSYGGRQEILRSARLLGEKIQRGEMTPAEVTEETFRSHLYQPEIPDPDLLIRTSGECRVSNFMLWELAYTEIVITPECWPEFTVPVFHEALAEFAKRERRFGKTAQQIQQGAHA